MPFSDFCIETVRLSQCLTSILQNLTIFSFPEPQKKQRRTKTCPRKWQTAPQYQNPITCTPHTTMQNNFLNSANRQQRDVGPLDQHPAPQTEPNKSNGQYLL
jgi:hypothetical protein